MKNYKFYIEYEFSFFVSPENVFFRQACYARILDYKRKFVEAAQRYNELSLKSIVSGEERMKALDNALICAILASAGPHRSRMLGTLFKDERSQRSPAYSMLNKMYT